MGKQAEVEEVELETEEEVDATPDDENTEDLDNESEQTEDTDIDKESGDKEDGEVDGDADPETEETEEVDPRDERISKLEETIETLKQGLTKKEEPSAPVKKERTEEEKARIQQLSGMEYQSVEFIESMMQNMVNQIKGYVEGELSASKKTSAIEKLSKTKGFEDAKKYEKGIDEFLSNFSPSVHSNEKILKMAYTYGKGLGIGNTIKKVINNKDKNKKIAGKSRPSGGSRLKGSSGRLSDEERNAARAAGMSESEYLEYKKPLSQIRGR